MEATSEEKLLQELQNSEEPGQDDSAEFVESSFGKGSNKKVILTTKGYTLKNLVQLAK